MLIQKMYRERKGGERMGERGVGEEEWKGEAHLVILSHRIMVQFRLYGAWRSPVQTPLKHGLI